MKGRLLVIKRHISRVWEEIFIEKDEKYYISKIFLWEVIVDIFLSCEFTSLKKRCMCQ